MTIHNLLEKLLGHEVPKSVGMFPLLQQEQW